MNGVGVLAIGGFEAIYGQGIKRAKSERMSINNHKGRLGVIRHVPSLHSALVPAHEE